MSIRNLDQVFEPGSVAVVGASGSPQSVAGVVTRNIVNHFKGAFHLINPKRDTVLGHPCLQDVAALDTAPDLALITSPADSLIPALTALGQKGAKGAVIISDLKRGTMPAAPMRGEIRKVARSYGMRIAGPNCLGLSMPALGLHASMSRLKAQTGTIAFIGQSATAAGPLVDWAETRGLGFSYLISLGDMIDIDYADVLYFLAQSRRTRCIVLYAERMPDMRRFFSALRHAARTKPVVIMKAGALTNDYLPEGAVIDPLLPSRDAVYDGAFRRAGLLRVRTLEALFDTVEALSARLPADVQPGHGDRLAILANGESIGTMAMDSLVERGGRLADLTPETIQRLSAALPPGRPRTNPVDILPDATGERYGETLDALMDDPHTDAILALAGPTGIASGEETATAVADAVQRARARPGRRRPWVLTSWPGGAEAEAARRVFAEAHIPTFATPSTAVAAFHVLLTHRAVSTALQETPASIPAAFNVDPVSARAIIADAQARGEASLDTRDAQSLLAAYRLTAAEPSAEEADLPLDWRIRTAVDPEFGPVLIFGLGGPYGRVTGNPSVGLPPLNEVLARDMILSHHAGGRIFRTPAQNADQAAQLHALALTLVQVSQLLVDQKDILRLDLDRITVSGGVATWGTARVDIAPPGAVPDDPHGRLAIRPYPQELERSVTSRKGLGLRLRPIRPEDEPALTRFFDNLTEEDIRMRFFRPLKTLDHAFLAGLTQIDYDWHMAFVLAGPGLPGDADIHGVVRLVRDTREESAEYAVIIRSDLHGHGLGRLLMEHIITYARDIGLGAIYGLVLAENEAMLGLNRKLGFTTKREPGEPGVLRVTLVL